MSSKKSLMGRRQFLIAAGVTSTSALALNKLSGVINPVVQTGVANASEGPGTAAVKDSGKMKCVVIYFSLTGSTEKIAKAIQQGVKQATGNCDIFPIKEANPRLLGSYDLIAFGNPLMGRNLKLVVSNFVENLRYVGGKHLFVFSTSHSGDNNFATLIPAMKKKGLITIGSKGWQGSVYGPLGEPSPAASDGHPDKIDLEEAEAFGEKMVEKSRKIYAGDKSLIPPDPAPPVFSTRVPELVGLEKLSLEDYQKAIYFHLIYDQTKCLYPTCHRCMDFCQVYGIDMTVEPRVIGKPCMNCMMCDQICPTGAITVDEAQMKWQAEIEHYAEKAQNAETRLEEMKKRKQNMPAGGAKRRQYVPDEKVVEGYSHQVYQVFNKRPRFIVGYGRPYGIDPATQEDRGPAKGV